MDSRQFHLFLIAGALTLPVILFFLHPLPTQTDEPPVALRLCREGITPCQREVNLPVGEQVTIDIFVEPSSATDSVKELSLAAWFFHMSLEDFDLLKVAPDPSTGLPFEERGSSGLALNGWEPLASSSSRLEPSPRSYHRLRNSYDPEKGVLEYGVVLLSPDSTHPEAASSPLQSWESTPIARITFIAQQVGETRLLLGGNASPESGVVIADSRGRDRLLDMAAEQTLFLINVGPAVNVRLEGRAWTEAPGVRGLRQPFTRALEVEIWREGELRSPQEHSAPPLARFTGVIPARDGAFAILDLTAEIVPEEVYDLRARGAGTLSILVESILVEDVPVNTLGENSPHPHHVIQVDLGPLLPGDLSGDNLIDEADLALLRERFGRMSDDSFGNPGDFNDDGMVDAQDFSLMAANLGRRGE